jgi:uncharacterized membrane protein
MAVANLGDKIIARPNNSLSVDDSVKLLAALAGIALVVALGFLHIGAWLVLPFAGGNHGLRLCLSYGVFACGRF